MRIDVYTLLMFKNVKNVHFYPIFTGIPALREAICNFHRKYDDLTCNPEDILVGPGSKELIFLAMNVFKGGILFDIKTYQNQPYFLTV